MINNKRGWIKLIEAFIAVLLITGALLIVVQKGYIGGKDISTKVYEAQKAILREVELSDDYRAQVLDVDKNGIPLDDGLPVTSSPTDTPAFPSAIINLIQNRKPDYLECQAVICELDVVCPLNAGPTDKDVYAQSVAIAATAEDYSPRQLKMFCWRL